MCRSGSSRDDKEASRVVGVSEQVSEPAPTSPVFEPDGFVIRAWQHPSSLRSPPKVNDKFASTFPVTGPGFSRAQAHKIQRDLWPESTESQGVNLTSTSDRARAGPPPASTMGVGSTAPSPTPRELYRQRQRWIRTYDEHSSELRSHTTHGAEQVVPLAQEDSLVTKPTTQTEISRDLAGVQPLVAQPQDAACFTESRASQTNVSVCDACTQTETLERDSVCCQTEEVTAIRPEETAIRPEELQSVLSATEQLAAMDGKSPSMEELDRLERLLQAEHRKIMGDLATLPEENHHRHHHHHHQQQQQQQQQFDVLKSTHDEWLAQTQVVPSVDKQIEAESIAAQQLVSRRMETEKAQVHTALDKFSYARAETSVCNEPTHRRDAWSLDAVATTASRKTIQQLDSACAAELEDATQVYRNVDQPHEHLHRHNRGTFATGLRASRRVPIREDAAGACTGFGQPMQSPDSPSTEPDGYGSEPNGLEAAHTSLESLAELEALLEEQHKQLIARGLIPADTPGTAQRSIGAQG